MTSTNSRDREPITIDATVSWEVDDLVQRVSEGEAASLLDHALGKEGQAGPWEIALCFVGDEQMSQLHARYMDDATPTDILTFPYNDEDEAAGGDIVISVDTAARNADAASWSTQDELRFLMLHGLLHIVGWDDHNDTDRAAMLARQHELLTGWKALGST